MTTAGPTPFRTPGSMSSGKVRSEIVTLEGIRMQATPVDLHPQDLLETDVAQVDVAPEMIEQGELARFRGCLEQAGLQAERVGEAVRGRPIEIAVVVETADPAGVFAGFDDDLARPGVKPAAALIDQLADDIRA